MLFLSTIATSPSVPSFVMSTVPIFGRLFGKDAHSFENCIMSMLGYVDDDRNRVHKMAEDVLAPALGRPQEELEILLLFSFIDHCLDKIRAFSEAGVKRIQFWPVSELS